MELRWKVIVKYPNAFRLRHDRSLGISSKQTRPPFDKHVLRLDIHVIHIDEHVLEIHVAHSLAPLSTLCTNNLIQSKALIGWKGQLHELSGLDE